MGPWFEYYSVLGDDVVILDAEVAKAYKVVMKRMDVGISPTKSLNSPIGHFEFAKRFMDLEQQFQALPLRALMASKFSLSVYMEVLSGLNPKVRVCDALRAVGLGYKAGSSSDNIKLGTGRAAYLKQLLIMPGKTIQSLPDMVSWLRQGVETPLSTIRDALLAILQDRYRRGTIGFRPATSEILGFNLEDKIPPEIMSRTSEIMASLRFLIWANANLKQNKLNTSVLPKLANLPTTPAAVLDIIRHLEEYVPPDKHLVNPKYLMVTDTREPMPQPFVHLYAKIKYNPDHYAQMLVPIPVPEVGVKTKPAAPFNFMSMTRQMVGKT